jgi:hypothetical protein
LSTAWIRKKTNISPFPIRRGMLRITTTSDSANWSTMQDMETTAHRYHIQIPGLQSAVRQLRGSQPSKQTNTMMTTSSSIEQTSALVAPSHSSSSRNLTLLRNARTRSKRMPSWALSAMRESREVWKKPSSVPSLVVTRYDAVQNTQPM